MEGVGGEWLRAGVCVVLGFLSFGLRDACSFGHLSCLERGSVMAPTILGFFFGGFVLAVAGLFLRDALGW